jgi:diadenylate cyclase
MTDILDALQQQLSQLPAEAGDLFGQLTATSVLDIVLVTLVFYALFRLFRGTQAVSLLRGILVVALIVLLAASRLTAFSWLLRNSLPVVLVAIPVIFQPELRRALERLGRSSPLLVGRSSRDKAVEQVVEEVVRASASLARQRTGALMVLEGATGLEEYIESGVRIDATVSDRLLTTLFYPGTPLHDGAVIIRGGQIAAAGCVLPLTNRNLADSSLGTRHRAAVGITEQNDALAVVVSEETGIISVARSGRLARKLDEQRLRQVLRAFYRPPRMLGESS